MDSLCICWLFNILQKLALRPITGLMCLRWTSKMVQNGQVTVSEGKMLLLLDFREFLLAVESGSYHVTDDFDSENREQSEISLHLCPISSLQPHTGPEAKQSTSLTHQRGWARTQANTFRTSQGWWWGGGSGAKWKEPEILPQAS